MAKALPQMNADNKPVQASPFWQFSLKFYAVPGVAPACIELQDQAGLDVNVLFFLLWSASEGVTLDETDVRELDRRVSAWRSTTVVPLRQMRRALKTPDLLVEPDAAEAFRDRIKAAELEAERLQQEAMFARAERFTAKAASPLAAARASVAAYRKILRPLPAQAMETVLAAFAKFAATG